jgi:hypothetical protein
MFAGGARPADAHPFHEQLELRLAVTTAAAWRWQQQQQQPAGRHAPGPTGSGTSTATLLAALSPLSPAAKRAKLGDGSSSSSHPDSSHTSAGSDVRDAAHAASPSADTPAVVQQLLDFLWDHIFDRACGHTLALRLSLLQHLLVPLLELAPKQEQRGAWYSSRVQQLRLLAEYGHAAAVAAPGDVYEEAWRLGSRCAAYK